jgi:transcriptional regulator with XRE-family HTH domain
VEEREVEDMPEQTSRSVDREEVDLPDEVQTSSGSWFSEKLKAAGFPSVDAFARHTGVPKSTAYQWERGSGAARPTNRPSKERILQLEEVLKVPATELVEKLWREKDGDPCPCGCGGYKSFEHTPPEPRRLWIVIPCAKCRTTENRSYKPWKKRPPPQTLQEVWQVR